MEVETNSVSAGYHVAGLAHELQCARLLQSSCIACNIETKSNPSQDVRLAPKSTCCVSACILA